MRVALGRLGATINKRNKRRETRQNADRVTVMMILLNIHIYIYNICGAVAMLNAC